MKNRRNYYRILHVQRDAPSAVIKASYRTMMQKLRLHPDLGGDEWNAAVINKAYSVLSDPDKRAAYDRWQAQGDDPVDPGAGQDRSGAGKPGRRPAAAGGKRAGSCCPFCGTPHHGRFPYGDSALCSGCSSPLQAVRDGGLAASTRRALHRSMVRSPLLFFTSASEPTGRPGTLLDLSPTGLQFRSPVPVGQGRVIRIVSSVVSAIAQVIHCRQEPSGAQYTIGVKLLTLRFQDKRGTFVSESA